MHHAGQLHDATFKMHSALNPAYCYIQWEARRDGKFCAVPTMLIFNPMTINLGSRRHTLPDRFADSAHSIFTPRRPRRAGHTGEQLDIGGDGQDAIMELLDVGTENPTSYTRAFVDSLPLVEITPNDVEDGCDSMECAICMHVSLKIGDKYKTFPCGCIMCLGCLMRWIVDCGGIKCPFCNQPVAVSDDTPNPPRPHQG